MSIPCNTEGKDAVVSSADLCYAPHMVTAESWILQTQKVVSQAHAQQCFRTGIWLCYVWVCWFGWFGLAWFGLVWFDYGLGFGFNLQ